MTKAERRRVVIRLVQMCRHNPDGSVRVSEDKLALSLDVSRSTLDRMLDTEGTTNFPLGSLAVLNEVLGRRFLDLVLMQMGLRSVDLQPAAPSAADVIAQTAKSLQAASAAAGQVLAAAADGVDMQEARVLEPEVEKAIANLTTLREQLRSLQSPNRA